MTRPILNLDDIPYLPWKHGERFEARLGQVASHIGAVQLGYNVTELPPGKAAFPFHSHRVNEEMFFVLSGVGEIRIGADRHPLRAGDFVACPAGDADTAHQIRNTSDSEALRFLAVSTMMFPEVATYPDSGKFLVREKRANADGSPSGLRFIGREGDTLDYWDGEEA